MNVWILESHLIAVTKLLSISLLSKTTCSWKFNRVDLFPDRCKLTFTKEILVSSLKLFFLSKRDRWRKALKFRPKKKKHFELTTTSFENGEPSFGNPYFTSCSTRLSFRKIPNGCNCHLNARICLNTLCLKTVMQYRNVWSGKQAKVCITSTR